MAETKLKLNQAFNQSPPAGFLLNGKIVPSVSSNNLTVAIKTLAGNDPSDADPVYIRIGDTIRTIRAALSVTANAATNWFNAGSSELATREIDYFVYLGYNATDGVVLGFARFPYMLKYGDFNLTSTNEKYAKISTITNAVSTDDYVNIGRFAATLSAGAGYTWTVPTYTTVNLIQRPIFQTRKLLWTPAFTGFSSNPAYDTGGALVWYQIENEYINIFLALGNGTSNAGTFSISIPITPAFQYGGGNPANNSGVYAIGSYQTSSNTLLIFRDGSLGANAFTASGNKSTQGIFRLYITYP